jgi:hypothetical protein
MADFALWVSAAEPQLGWKDRAFLDAYERNVAGGHDRVLDASPLTEPLRTLVASDDWMGTAAQLLAELDLRVESVVRERPGWPRTPQALGSALNRLAPNLREIGVEVAKGAGHRVGHRGTRMIEVRKTGATLVSVVGGPGAEARGDRHMGPSMRVAADHADDADDGGPLIFVPDDAPLRKSPDDPF